MRIRNKWRNKKPRTLTDIANAVAYIIWQIALHYGKNLHTEKFDYESDEQRTSVIREYLYFLCHITDRYTFNRLSTKERKYFVTTLVKDTARQYQRNVEQIAGAGCHGKAFLCSANMKFDQYANGDFDQDMPGYSARRMLGNLIQEIMGDSQTNKWVVQQIIDIDSLEAAEQLIKGIGPLIED